MDEEKPQKKLGDLPDYTPPQDLSPFELTEEQKFRLAFMFKPNPFLIGFFTLIGIVLGYLGYLYFFQLPDMTIIDAQARYSQNKASVYQFDITFKVKNSGNGKTIESKLYSAVLDPRNFVKNASLLGYSEDRIPDLKEEEIKPVVTRREMDAKAFRQYLLEDRGIYLSTAIRWKSRNFAFRGRTFENYLLFFLKQGVSENFEIYYVRQSQRSWFKIDDTRAPDLEKLAKKLDLTSDKPRY